MLCCPHFLHYSLSTEYKTAKEVRINVISSLGEEALVHMDVKHIPLSRVT